MILKKLNIHNLASIEDASIDFSDKPLSDTDVFLITGKTGSGKSTILDAVCLALYGDIPRFNSSQIQGVTRELEEEDIKNVRDIRQILRRNTGEGYVILSFTGNNGNDYEACWSVARARKKIKGRLQKKNWVLKNLNTGVSLTNDKDIKEEIKQAVRLDLNQFCRTTVLAQGEFSKFLNSKDDEKAAILEKITGRDDFSLIGKTVYEITSEKEREWKEAKRHMEGIMILDDDEIECRKKEIERLSGEDEAENKTLDILRKKVKWLETEKELLAKEEKAGIEYDEILKIIENDETVERKKRVKDWYDTVTPRNMLSSKKIEEKKIEKEEKVIEGYKDTYRDLLKGYNHVIEERERLSLEIEKLHGFLEGEKENKLLYDSVEVIKSLVKSYLNAKETIGTKRTEIKNLEKYLNETLIPESKRLEDEEKLKKDRIEEISKSLSDLDAIVNGMDLPGLRINHKGLLNKKGKIEISRERLKLLQSLENEIRQKKEEISNSEKEIEIHNKRLHELLIPQQEAETALKHAKIEFESRKDSIDSFARTMRAKLNVGDECPVCRQKISSLLPSEREIKEYVDAYAGKLEECEKKVEDIYKNKSTIEAETKVLERNYSQLISDLDKIVLKEKNNSEELIPLFDELGLNLKDIDRSSKLNDLLNKNNSDIADLEQKIKAGEEIENRIKDNNKKLQTLRSDLDEIVKKIKKNTSDRTTYEIAIKEKFTIVEENVKETGKIETRLSEMVKDNWEADPSLYCETLETKATHYACEEKRKQSCEAKLFQMDITVSSIRDTIKEIENIMPEWHEITESESKIVDNISGGLTSLLKNLTVAKTSREEAKTNVAEWEKNLALLLKEDPTLSIERLEVLGTLGESFIKDEEENLLNQERRFTARKTELENIKRDIKTLRESKPEFEENDTPDSIAFKIETSENHIKSIAERKGAINEQLKQDAENKKSLLKLIEKADGLKKIYDKWARLNSLIGDKEGTKFRKIAQSYVLAELIHTANYYMATLSPRYTLKGNPGTFLINVEDAFNGYVTRTANTLSGGETFLVSLSLALALSDFGRQLAVNTLFIDEGFGSLSGDPLRRAIDTLRTLHARSGRHVGIISHIEELKEKIPVQIRVEQDGNSSVSRIRVVP